MMATAQAQGLKFGVKGGLNITNMSFTKDVMTKPQALQERVELFRRSSSRSHFRFRSICVSSSGSARVSVRRQRP